MPRYFFHIRNSGSVTRDDEGDDLPNLAAACAEALAIAREMWAALLREGEGRDYMDAVIIITDRKGRQLMIVSFLEALPPRLYARLEPTGHGG